MPFTPVATMTAGDIILTLFSNASHYRSRFDKTDKQRVGLLGHRLSPSHNAMLLMGYG